MGDGEGAVDHAAQGKADDGGALDLQVVEQAAELIDKAGQVVGARRLDALAVAQQIVTQQAKTRRQGRQLPIPHLAVQPEAVDQDHRWPLPQGLEAGAVEIPLGHAASPAAIRRHRAEAAVRRRRA
jgi:hypothetical protein